MPNEINSHQNIHFNNFDPKSSDRIKTDFREGQLQISTPSKSAMFGRVLANVVTLGRWTRHIENRSQWRAFRNFLLTKEGLTAERVTDLLAGYDKGKRLNMAKVNIILSGIENDRVKPPRSSKWLRLRSWFGFEKGNESQNALLRLCSTARAWLRNVWDTKQEKELKADDDIIKDTLRYGRKMRIYSRDQAMQGLQTNKFNVEANSDTFLKKFEQKKFDDREGIIAIPLSLKGGKHQMSNAMFPREDHSVLLAIDIDKKKILYLDPKGESIEDAKKNYKDIDGLDKIVDLVSDHFNPVGENSAEQNNAAGTILQLTQAKQRGANDCIPFTWKFAKMLKEGKSLMDIESELTRKDRLKVRIEMAQDLQNPKNNGGQQFDNRGGNSVAGSTEEFQILSDNDGSDSEVDGSDSEGTNEFFDETRRRPNERR